MASFVKYKLNKECCELLFPLFSKSQQKFRKYTEVKRNGKILNIPHDQYFAFRNSDIINTKYKIRVSDLATLFHYNFRDVRSGFYGKFDKDLNNIIYYCEISSSDFEKIELKNTNYDQLIKELILILKNKSIV